MIIDDLSNIEKYQDLDDLIFLGMKFLQDTDFSFLVNGRYEIMGDSIYANVMNYDTAKDRTLLEAHEKYIDLQYLIMGSEIIGVAPVSEMEKCVSQKPEEDCWMYEGNSGKFNLMHGSFALIYPNEAHITGLFDGVATTCRKCVVKIKHNKT